MSEHAEERTFEEQAEGIESSLTFKLKDGKTITWQKALGHVIDDLTCATAGCFTAAEAMLESPAFPDSEAHILLVTGHRIKAIAHALVSAAMTLEKGEHNRKMNVIARTAIDRVLNGDEDESSGDTGPDA